MALLLFSFLFIIIVRSEHTHSNTILRLSQTVDTALNLTDCHICHPSSGHHDKNLWASSVLLNKIIGSFSRWHLHLYRQMTLNKSTSEFSSALLCLWIQQRSWGDGPITCHLEETNKRSKYVTRLMRAFLLTFHCQQLLFSWISLCPLLDTTSFAAICSLVLFASQLIPHALKE